MTGDPDEAPECDRAWFRRARLVVPPGSVLVLDFSTTMIALDAYGTVAIAERLSWRRWRVSLADACWLSNRHRIRFARGKWAARRLLSALQQTGAR